MRASALPLCLTDGAGICTRAQEAEGGVERTVVTYLHVHHARGLLQMPDRSDFEVRALSRWLSDFAKRYAQRQRLYGLDDKSISDLGRERVREELMRPFWQAGFSGPPGKVAVRGKALKRRPRQD